MKLRRSNFPKLFRLLNAWHLPSILDGRFFNN
jgi:hypothetical protein